MSFDLYSFEIWAARISFSIAFVFAIFLLLRNHKHKRQANKDSIPPKYLNLWSNITLCLTPICILIEICEKIPFICVYAMPLDALSYGSPKIFLCYFQLARLKLCFANSDVIPSSLTYSKYLFYLLYFVGVIILIGLFLVNFLFLEINVLSNNMCIAVSKKHYEISGTSLGLIYTIWDGTIVCLYIHKLYQLKQNIGNHNNNKYTQEVLERINLQLNKILFLTIIMEACVNTMIPIGMWGTFNVHILLFIDYIIVQSIMFLMLEHNCKDYAKFLLLLNKVGCIKRCCCCFKNLDGRKQIVDNKPETKQSKPAINKPKSDIVEIKPDEPQQAGVENVSVDTKSEDDNISKIKYVDQSQMTETNNNVKVDL